MERFSASLALCAGNSPVPVNSPHKGQWRGALMFSLICVWINGWVNNREAGDLRRHRCHYDVNVMCMQYRVTLSRVGTGFHLHSSPFNTVYMRRWTGSSLVQVMACRLFDTKPLPEAVVAYWIFKNKLQWNSNRNTKLFIFENAFTNFVGENGVHLSWVDWKYSRNTNSHDFDGYAFLGVKINQSYRLRCVLNVKHDRTATNHKEMDQLQMCHYTNIYFKLYNMCQPGSVLAISMFKLLSDWLTAQ